MSDFVFGLLIGVVLLGLYSWWLVETAASVAMKRIEQAFKDSMDNPDDTEDIINRLDRMWGGKRDDD